MPQTYNTRRFTTDNPILYNGQYYPSTTMPVDDGNGNIQDTTVFADRAGNYYTPNGQNVILQGSLPEVAVYPSNKKYKGLTDHASEAIAMDYSDLAKLQSLSTEEILNRQAMMRAAGYKIPQGSAWDSNQQNIWNTLTTKPKEYDTTLTGLAEGLWDKLNGNDTFFANPMDQGEIKKYNPDEVDWSKTRKSQSKVVNAIQGTWAPIAAAAAAPEY